MERFVYEKKYYNYGRVNLTVSRMLREKHIKPYKLSTLTGIRYDVLKKYIDGNLYRIDLDVIARICFALNCNLEDLLKYQKSNSHPILVKSKYN